MDGNDRRTSERRPDVSPQPWPRRTERGRPPVHRSPQPPPVPPVHERDAEPPTQPVRRPPSRRPSRPRTLGSALLATAAATVAPGAGHLLLGRRRAGAAILGVFLLVLTVLMLLVLTSHRSALLGNLLSTQVLVAAVIGCLLAALAWIAVIVRTYLVARPPGLDPGRRTVGVVVVAALCLLVAAPFGFAASIANSQRNLLDALFPSDGGGTSVAEAIGKPRLNLLLVGSDAGPDRIGTRTDTMMVASIDTVSGRTTLFGLPRNIGYARFPPGSAMAEEFPDGFHDRSDPDSGDYLLNAVYSYGHQYPAVAPPGPTRDPGLNLLHQTISYMLGLQLDYFVEVDMAGFASIIDALGGLTVDVGAEPIPVGGITATGREVRPDRYLRPGVQRLSGEDALAFARSRTGSTDYARMGRQRCLIQNILDQKSPTDLLTNFREVAAATTNNVSTNIPQPLLPMLASLADGEGGLSLESVSFDPSLPDPEESDGRFDTGRPNFPYMRQVVQDAIDRDPVRAPATAAAPTAAPDSTSSPTPTAAPLTARPTSLARSC